MAFGKYSDLLIDILSTILNDTLFLNAQDKEND